jgi:hypothetical protein
MLALAGQACVSMWPEGVRMSVLGRSLRLTYNDTTALTEETLLQAPRAGVQLEQGPPGSADVAGDMAAGVAEGTAGTSWDELEAAVGLWPRPPPRLPGTSMALR